MLHIGHVLQRWEFISKQKHLDFKSDTGQLKPSFDNRFIYSFKLISFLKNI